MDAGVPVVGLNCSLDLAHRRCLPFQYLQKATVAIKKEPGDMQPLVIGPRLSQQKLQLCRSR
ncbi:hypothetical protein GCM10011378_16240 [Hymenobacter glacieicola]|uniref:Hcy-binding domain-containing protein n=1 Tax=Hymenobacter glacieicola TaxID=1562124 RepID=A0ABQ1WPF7_9BACT|nr:hypothetical protein GCM10011378_16240 [Hymenobacter glacieicola]